MTEFGSAGLGFVQGIKILEKRRKILEKVLLNKKGQIKFVKLMIGKVLAQDKRI